MSPGFLIDLIPRPDYAVFPLELPHFSRKDREQAVINKLRGFYPGSLEDRCIVVQPNGKRGSYLVFVFDNVLKVKEDPLSLSTLAARKFVKKGLQYCAIATPSWIEYLVIEDGRVVSTMVAGREEGEVAGIVSTAAVEVFGFAEGSVTVYCADADGPLSSEVVSNGVTMRFMSLNKELAVIARSAYSCFPDRLVEVKRRRMGVRAFVFCVVIVGGAVVYRWYGGRASDGIRRIEEARLAAVEATVRKAEEEKLTALGKVWKDRVADLHVTVYETLETLASCLSPAIRVYSADFKEGGFQLEAGSNDAIAVLQRLEEHPRIANTAIRAIIWNDGMQRFTVTGTVERLMVSGKSHGSVAEQIAWYESELTMMEKRNKGMVESAAIAAESVWNLLWKYRCNVNRFRYLESEGGWTIESTITTSSIQLVRVLKDAAMPENPLRVLSLQTRNRTRDIEAVITFFVQGPGGVLPRGDYEEHPNETRIASLYYGYDAQNVTSSDSTPLAVLGVPLEPRVKTNNPARSLTLEYIGFIGTTDGKQHVYVKDTRSGDMYRLTEGADNYSYRLNGTELVATIDGLVYDVKRTDGF
jgi:hypothetical protein